MIKDGWKCAITSAGAKPKSNAAPLQYVDVVSPHSRSPLQFTDSTLSPKVAKGRLVILNRINQKYMSEYKLGHGLTHVVTIMTNKEGAASTYNVDTTVDNI